MVRLTSWLGPILFLAGIFLGIYDLAWVGVICFAGAALFSLITLPVELDASRRGLKLLDQAGLVRTDSDKQGSRRVLMAAASTYLAAALTAVLQLLYYMSIARRRS